MEIGRLVSEVLGRKAEVVARAGSGLLERVKHAVTGTAFKTVESLPPKQAEASAPAQKPLESASPRKPAAPGPQSKM